MLILQNAKPQPILGVSFAATGKSLIVGGSGGFEIWKLSNASKQPAASAYKVESHTVPYIFRLALEPKARWAYVADYRGGFRILGWGKRKTKPPPGSPHARHVTSFGVSEDGSRLVMNRSLGSSRIECWQVSSSGSFTAEWSLLDGKPIDPDEPYYLNAGFWSSKLALSDDGSLIVSAETRVKGASGDRPLIVTRHAKSGRQIAELGVSTCGFRTRISVAPDNQTAFVWDDTTLERWDLQAGKRTHKIASPGTAYFMGLALHPKGQSLLVVAGGGQVRTLDAGDLLPLSTQKLPIGKLHSVAIHPSGLLGAAGGVKGQTAVWELSE